MCFELASTHTHTYGYNFELDEGVRTSGVAGAPAERCSELHGLRGQRTDARPSVRLRRSYLVPAAASRRPPESAGARTGRSSQHADAPAPLPKLAASCGLAPIPSQQSSAIALLFHGHGGGISVELASSS